MKRVELISIVEQHLEEMGFQRGSWLWQPRSSQLIVVMGQTLKQITLKTSMTKRALAFEMGRLAGLAEAAGMALRAAVNQAPKHSNGNGVAGWASGAIGTFAGMPA